MPVGFAAVDGEGEAAISELEQLQKQFEEARVTTEAILAVKKRTIAVLEETLASVQMKRDHAMNQLTEMRQMLDMALRDRDEARAVARHFNQTFPRQTRAIHESVWPFLREADEQTGGNP